MDAVLGLLLLLVLQCMAFIEGEIRCYCNESGCVSTGYMCKSQLGQCYSLLNDDRDSAGESTRSVHGCVDSLRSEQRSKCAEDGDIPGASSEQGQLPLHLCCTRDMCNYVKHVGGISFVMNAKSNGSTQKEFGRQLVSGSHVSYSGSVAQRNADRDLWFKAAVIAVPIAGSFILIVLVLVAVRMLRIDSKRHRRLLQMRRERSLTKAQLYVADHFSEKSDKASCPSFAEKASSIYKDMNARVNKDGKIYEKVNDKDFQQKLSPSVILWGKSPKSDFATVV